MNQNNKINFEKKEGDKYFRRNIIKDKLPFRTDRAKLLVDWLKPYSEKIDKVLELGCGSGINLDIISRGLNAKGFGIDPTLAPPQPSILEKN